MQIKIVGSTHPEYTIDKEEALLFSGKAAGVCYLPNTFDELIKEDVSRTKVRINRNLTDGHYSVFGHVHYTLVIENAPKILAMILNNEKVYNTSEKSARYTKMQVSGEEERFFVKWSALLQKEIEKICPQYSSRALKLAQENARYFVSVFTPSTTMVYTASLMQLNFLMCWAEDFINSKHTEPFFQKLQLVMRDFLQAMPDIKIKGLNDHMKKRSFSLFGSRIREESFKETYSVNYAGTFAQLAQSQRHRTLAYEMMLFPKQSFYIPLILRDDDWLRDEWLTDMEKVSNLFPQGMLVHINERGTAENFILKCTERLCGASQLEIAMRTQNTLKRYVKNSRCNSALNEYLTRYDTGARCTFEDWKCANPCIFGAKFALSRLI